MNLDNFWNETILYFHHEFIDSPSFPESKKELLESDSGTYFIPKDFTIYQKKSHPFDELNETDYHINQSSFVRILYHMPPIKVRDFLEYHLNKFEGNKLDFINHIYHDYKESTLRQGKKKLPDPQQKLILLQWCEEKAAELEGRIISRPIKLNRNFIHLNRIEDLKKVTSVNFDLKKLIRILEEINSNYQSENFYSVAMLSRAVIDHIPPIFGFKKFDEVANNFGSKSFKGSMEQLNKSLRNIADGFLHGTIRKSENIPNENQINFEKDIDVLLGEIIIQLKE